MEKQNKKINQVDAKQFKGTVVKELFDTKKLEVFNHAVEANITDKKYLNALLEAARKPIFKNNILWSIFKKLTGKDLKIPFLFGYWTTKPIAHNLVPTRGKEKIVDLIGGSDTTPVSAIAVGTGTTAAAAGDTALQTEITDSGLGRGAATVSNVTTTTTNDTVQFVKSFSVSGTKAVTEEGLLDNNTTGGVLLARQVFSAINVVSGDTLQITHKVQAT